MEKLHTLHNNLKLKKSKEATPSKNRSGPELKEYVDLENLNPLSPPSALFPGLATTCGLSCWLLDLILALVVLISPQIPKTFT